MAYVFSRSTESTQPDYAAIAASGATIALNAEDPHLRDQIARARANNCPVAIWIPAHTDQDAAKYGRDMAAIVQFYKPDAILPNIETQGEGQSGSAWSAAMMTEYAKYVAPGTTKLDVVVAPNKPQGTFDYSSYLKYGGVVAEAFGGDVGKEQWDPQKIHDVLLQSGVPENKINVLLAPGQSRGNLNNVSAYTWDDMSPVQQTAFLKDFAAQNTAMTSPATPPTPDAAPTTPTPDASPVAGPPPVGSKAGWAQVKDANNPAAIAYAKQRLAGAAKLGYKPENYGITGDPTAQWRALSSIIGAVEAANAGKPYTAPVSANPQVAAEVQAIADRAAAAIADRRSKVLPAVIRANQPDAPSGPPPNLTPLTQIPVPAVRPVLAGAALVNAPAPDVRPPMPPPAASHAVGPSVAEQVARTAHGNLVKYM